MAVPTTDTPDAPLIAAGPGPGDSPAARAPDAPGVAVAAHAAPFGFRADVEGLRAIAVVMVMIYHAGATWLPGGFAGVDVFFVISGYLITNLLLKEIERDGRISLSGFYARRAKRLLPAAGLVLAATAVAGYFLLPRTGFRDVGGDVFAAAFYVINWRLAHRSVDYLAEDAVASPVQHFWSLAVEEQYYLVWPALLALAVLAGGPRAIHRKLAWVALLAMTLPSLVWSVLMTESNPAAAYFVSTTRAWELGIGGAVALLSTRLRALPGRLAAGIGWAGLAAVVASGLWQSAAAAWPGYAALLPTLGTAAVIAAGSAAGSAGPVRLLRSPALVWIGGISYSLYLWHWPVIVYLTMHLGRLSLTAAIAAIAASTLLAWTTQRYVENPVRFSVAMSRSPKYALSVGLNFTLLGALAAMLLLAGVRTAGPAAEVAGSSTVPVAAGAAVIGKATPADLSPDRVDWMTPLPEMATEDLPAVYADGCQQSQLRKEAKSCIYGDADGDVTVAVVGDSKMVQWMSALDAIAAANGWKLVTYTKGSCGFSAAKTIFRGKPFRSCHEWNEAVMAGLVGLKPDFVITSHGTGSADGTGFAGADPVLVAGFERWWSALQEQGAKVIALADNPNPGMNVYECVSRNPEALRLCEFPRADGLGTPSLRAAAVRTGTAFIDLTDFICPGERCPPVIGNVLVYRHSSHLTKTYVDTIAPMLEDALLEAGMPARDPGGAAVGASGR